MKYKINKGLISQILDRKLTIFDGEKSILYTFNDTASFIFNELKKNQKEETIVENLIKTFKIDKKIAEKDFSNFIKDLIEKKIISK